MEINACRLCLAKEDLALLFGSLSPCQFTRDQVFLATGVVISPSDYLPQAACKTCIEQIKSAIHLRDISTKTQHKFQLIYPKINFPYEKDSSANLLLDIDNYKTNDVELNELLKKINKKVAVTMKSLADSSQCDNNSAFDSKILTNDHLNVDNNSQPDNHSYQTDLDHNYHLREINLPINIARDRITKHAEKDLKNINTTNKMKMVIQKILNFPINDDNLIKKRNYMRFKSNTSLLPAKQFKKLVKHRTQIFSNKCTEDTKNIKHATSKTKLNKTSQPDNEISHPDNKSSQPDNYDDNADNEDGFNSLVETEDWDENQLKEIEVQKHKDKERQNKFMSLAVRPYPSNGRLQCKVCLQSVSRHGFVTHAKRHFPPEFACETCGKMFYGNSSLQYHRQRMHGLEKPLACSLCDYRAILKQDLTAHMRIHTGERPYICDVCAASFRVRGDIVQHLRTHFGVKRIQCPRCPHKLFRCLSDVAKHNRRVHHDFTYFCHICPQTYHGYSGRKSVRKHMLRIHGIPFAEQPLKLKYTKIPK